MKQQPVRWDLVMFKHILTNKWNLSVEGGDG